MTHFSETRNSTFYARPRREVDGGAKGDCVFLGTGWQTDERRVKRSAKEEGSILSIQTLDDTRRVGPERAEGWPARFMASESHHHRDQVPSSFLPFSFWLYDCFYAPKPQALRRFSRRLVSRHFLSPAPRVPFVFPISLLLPRLIFLPPRKIQFARDGYTRAAPSHNATDSRKRKRA